MHELVKNEKKEGKARPLTRTGPTALSDSHLLEEQQKRIAARAATAMAQVLRRRREPRSLLIWGDRKKAIIKRYPDGSQEIIVPQSLTQEQQNYEFPPRSKFLISLATSAALVPSVSEDPIIHNQFKQDRMEEMKQPDPFALNEWFSKRCIRTASSKPYNRPFSNDKVVMDWIKNVPIPSPQTITTTSSRYSITKPSPTRSNCSNKIQFKSDAGKRWANNITSNTSLQPPDDLCKKHYVPRRLLHKKNKIEPNVVVATEAASKIQMIWKEYQNKNTHQHYMENKIGITAMESTGERTPIAGMVHLVQMLHDSLKVQQQKSQGRLEKLEFLLEEETKKRVSAEDSMRKLESHYNEKPAKNKVFETLLSRVNEIEKKESLSSRKKLILEDSNKKVIIKKRLIPPPPTTKNVRLKRPVIPEKKSIDRSYSRKGVLNQ